MATIWLVLAIACGGEAWLRSVCFGVELGRGMKRWRNAAISVLLLIAALYAAFMGGQTWGGQIWGRP